MIIRWPPAPLGLGRPLNLACSSSDTQVLLRRSLWLAPVLGVAIPLLMLETDRMLFGGVSLQRVRDLGSEPLVFRLLLIVYSGLTEELVYRLFLATLVAWLAYLALSRVVSEPKILAQWLGIVVAAVLFGLAHVGNIPDAPQPVLRAVTVNGIAGLILGWLYWSRGLEIAVLTHMAAIAVLYIAVPPFL
jgi:membrane protease YdiL (CAAX protease family)